jgi:hypothetical protein
MFQSAQFVDRNAHGIAEPKELLLLRAGAVAGLEEGLALGVALAPGTTPLAEGALGQR